MDVLKRAVGKGQLTFDEFEERVTVVYAARVRGDQRPVLEDLEEYQVVRANPRLSMFWLD